MTKKVNIRLENKERMSDFIKALEGIDCCFEIKVGKNAVEATNPEDMAMLDLSVSRPLCIYGDQLMVEQAVERVGAFCV